TMLYSFGDELEKVSQEFNDYLTVDNILQDYALADDVHRKPPRNSKSVYFITYLDPSVKLRLDSHELRNLCIDIDFWFTEGEHPTHTLSALFELFISRKIDYFGINIVKSDEPPHPADSNHSPLLSLMDDSLERRVVALLGVLIRNCSVSDQKRILSVLKLKNTADQSVQSVEHKTFYDIVETFIYAQEYKHS
ncbi:MAG: hypothetical protein RSA84_20425, partial [Acinetobacter sp.]